MNAATRPPRLWIVEEFGHGGIGRYAVDVANLVLPVVDTVVATTDHGPVAGLQGRSTTWFPRGSDSTAGKVCAAATGLVRAVRSVRRGDVAWIPLGIRPLFEMLLVLALRAGGARVVATVHNRAPHGKRGTSSTVVRAARLADSVVVHTGALETWAHQEGLHQLVRLPFPPPDLGSIDDRPRPSRAELGLPADGVLVAFLGYLYPYKGPDVLLRALALARRDVPNLPVHVVMAGRPTADLDLPALARRLDLGSSLTLRPGWLEEETMADLLSVADVLALPYRRIDNSGIGALGRQWRLPAVASALPPLEDAFGDGALLVPPDDPAALSAALQALPARLDGLRAAAMATLTTELEGPYQEFTARLVRP